MASKNKFAEPAEPQPSPEAVEGNADYFDDAEHAAVDALVFGFEAAAQIQHVINVVCSAPDEAETRGLRRLAQLCREFHDDVLTVSALAIGEVGEALGEPRESGLDEEAVERIRALDERGAR
ncbi:MAG: hypothetical protein HYS27_02400 [Deltaproteobacteria bacterium]|nr:hypothetical protein [Deltaproteobacteria bacterium]